ncbi:MAG: hypothetical protein JJU05_15120 [Verrucomicrobia bacterium]|nr:hypothetical protein [Verrucomicrobiota bacterium]MCH8528145.1 hypothetical protein [Kiritimatiellia bacterium]
MIIYGSRVYGKKDLIAYFGTCEKCGVYGPQRSYSGRRWGHVYWLPLIPMGGKLQIFHECKSCKQAHSLPFSDVESTRARFKGATDRALAALLAGRNTVDVDGQPADCVNEIGGALDILLAFGERNYIKLLVAALRQQPNCEYAHRVCEGLWAEFEGDLEFAEEHFRSALRISNRSTLPAASLVRLYMHGKKYDAAEAVLEKVLAVSEDAGLLGLQARVRTLSGDTEGAVISYEAFFRALPEAAFNKGIYKDYRKLCGKTRREPLPPESFGPQVPY